MSLDCNSSKGRVWIGHQNDTSQILAKEWGCQMVGTPDNASADIDFICCRNGIAKAILEIKSRNLSREELERWGTYLVTLDKLERGRSLAKSLACNFILAVRLVKDDTIIYWVIADETGNFVPNMQCSRTKTQDNCNGGTANRYNAYLPVTDGRWITQNKHEDVHY